MKRIGLRQATRGPKRILHVEIGVGTAPGESRQSASADFGDSVFRSVRKIAKRDCWVRHARLSVRLEQLDSHCTDFDEI